MTEPVSIRLAKLADATRIAEMSRDYVEAGLSWNWTSQRVARNISDRETNVAVATSGIDLAGFGIMKYQDSDAHLMLFAVAPSFRRRGVGKTLMDWLEASAITAGIDLIWLEARVNNSTALAFYGSRGYRTLDRMHRYYSGVEDAVRVAKDLSESKPSSYLDK